MVLINEWLPNPAGPDAAGEFAELFNDTAVAIPLDGWSIGTGTGTTTPERGEAIVPLRTKAFSLGGRTVPGRGYLVVTRGEGAPSFKNTDGAVLLYGPDGSSVDRAAFHGAAPEGKSFSRIEEGAATGMFVFTDPTPGSANAAFGSVAAPARYEAGVPVGPPGPGPVFAVISALGLGAVVMIIFIYAVKKNEYVSHLLFGGDEAPRRGVLERISEGDPRQ